MVSDQLTEILHLYMYNCVYIYIYTPHTLTHTHIYNSDISPLNLQSTFEADLSPPQTGEPAGVQKRAMEETAGGTAGCQHWGCIPTRECTL